MDIMKWYLLSACTKRNPHVALLKRTAGRGGNECSSTEIFFLSFFSCFLVSKVAKVLRFAVFQTFCFFVFVLFLMNSTFSFPLCCNVGSHGSNFDVLKVLFPTHICH